MRKAIDWDDVKARLKMTQSALENALGADAARMAAVFTRRAEQFARRRVTADADAPGLQVLGFLLGSESYFVELSEIAEILPLQMFTPVPAAPVGLFGVFNLRGEIVPIVDLAKVLERSSGETVSTGYLLVLRRSSAREAALKVDQLQRIRHLPADEVLPSRETLLGRTGRYIKGMTRDAARVLDVDELLAHAIFGND